MAVTKKTTKAAEKKYVATVMEITHGGFFSKHKHYDVKVIELEPDSTVTVEVIARAAKGAAKLADSLLPGTTKVVSCEEIEITTMAQVRAKGASVNSIIKK